MGVLREQLLAEEAADYGNAGVRQQVVWPNGVLASSAVGLFMSLILPWSPKLMPVLLEYDGNRGTIVPSLKLQYMPQTCVHFQQATRLGALWNNEGAGGESFSHKQMAVGKSKRPAQIEPVQSLTLSPLQSIELATFWATTEGAS